MPRAESMFPRLAVTGEPKNFKPKANKTELMIYIKFVKNSLFIKFPQSFPRRRESILSFLFKHFKHALSDQITADNVKGGNATAAVPRIMVKGLFASAPAAIKAPIIMIPQIALASDIKGVCSNGGTREISANPKNTERTKINKR